MRHSELLYVLALQKVEGIGDINAKKLLAKFGSAEAVFTAPAKDVSFISPTLHKRLKEPQLLFRAEKELNFIERNDICVHFYLDTSYPDRLRHCSDAPILLFGRGQMDLKNGKIISIVGTRQVTAYGTEMCRKLISDLSPLNPIIISGLAYGVDIVAHQAAHENGLQTIGVVAHGLNQVYPRQHQKFVNKIESNGGLLSEFWSTSNPDKENFVRRNRIVAGISEATIVIESAEKGGSLITAALALDYNREVFAVPGRATDKYSTGCNNLIKTQKANVITSAADLVYVMNWKVKADQQKPVQKQLFVTLEGEEQPVYNHLCQTGKDDFDSIALQCKIPVSRLATILLTMELKGVVRPLPGKVFEAI